MTQTAPCGPAELADAIVGFVARKSSISESRVRAVVERVIAEAGDGAVEHLPDRLVQRLAEGGRVVCGVLRGGITRLAIGRKAAGEVALVPLAEIGIPALAEFAARKEWSF